jgi:hypothetical protein
VNDEQEMQFADPAWEPNVTREFEAIAPASPPTGASNSKMGAATTTQAGEANYGDYARGYQAQSAPGAEGEYPSQSQQPPPLQGQRQQSFQGQNPPFQGQQPLTLQALQNWLRRFPIWVWWVIGVVIVGGAIQSITSGNNPVSVLFNLILVGALVFAGWLLWTRRVRVNLAGETQAAETHTFTVGAQPTVILKNKAGSINLRAGQEGQVSITTTRRGYLFSPRLDKETLISYSQDSAANIVTARTGSWRPFGKNAIGFEVVVPPQANLQLSTNFGNISVQNVAGQLSLHADAGSIQATDVTLQGKSRLKTDAGTIAFSGSLDPAGKYELITDLGTIDATLTANSSFELTAKTDLGTIATNLPLNQPQRNKAYGTVGSGPYPKLKVKTDVGTINIQRR